MGACNSRCFKGQLEDGANRNKEAEDWSKKCVEQLTGKKNMDRPGNRENAFKAADVIEK